MNATLCPRHATPFSARASALALFLGLPLAAAGGVTRAYPAHALAPPVALGCSSAWGGSVGANFGKDNGDGRLYARDVPPDMAAARAGLRVGDEVVAIDGKPVASMTPAEADGAFQGAVGSVVVLTVKRGSGTLDLRVERGPLR